MIVALRTRRCTDDLFRQCRPRCNTYNTQTWLQQFDHLTVRQSSASDVAAPKAAYARARVCCVFAPRDRHFLSKNFGSGAVAIPLHTTQPSSWGAARWHTASADAALADHDRHAPTSAAIDAPALPHLPCSFPASPPQVPGGGQRRRRRTPGLG